MAQLTGLGLKNFRVFKDEVFFDFAPITILTGTNNSGKSSVFKALLLLKDSYQKNKLDDLNFDGEKHHLGSFENTVCRGIDENLILFRLRYTNSDSIFDTKEFNLEIVYKKTKEDGELVGFLIYDEEKGNILFHYDDYAMNDYTYFKFDIRSILRKIKPKVKENKEKETKSEIGVKIKYINTDRVFFDRYSFNYDLGENILSLDKINQYKDLSTLDLDYLKKVLIDQKIELYMPSTFFIYLFLFLVNQVLRFINYLIFISQKMMLYLIFGFIMVKKN